ncbi:MAG: hypothetical protein ABIA63_01335 [bacterium]
MIKFCIALFLSTAIFSFGNTKQVLINGNMIDVKKAPADSAEAIYIAQHGSLFKVKSTIVDSIGMVWFLIELPRQGASAAADSGWINGKYIRYVQDKTEADQLEKALENKQKDKKRRIAVIKKNPDWPRRIKNAVRNGVVCIYMTSEQLEAAWGKPDYTARSYMIGVGNYNIFYYNSPSPAIVSLQNNQVIGWSLDSLAGNK